MSDLPELGARLEALYWWIAAASFIVAAGYETFQPDRTGGTDARSRWPAHLAIYAACVLVTWWVVPAWVAARVVGEPSATTAFARLDARAGSPAVLLLGCLLIDLVIYLVHRTEHAVFLLWRFHAVHHADTAMDVTTAYRHHPGEYLLSGILVASAAAAAGLPVWVFPFYAALTSLSGLFQHMNGAVPDALDRALSRVIMTPAMHRLHHSIRRVDHDSNYGAVFSVWDRLFCTFRQPSPDPAGRIIYGIVDAPRDRPVLASALLLPFAMRRPHAAPASVGRAARETRPDIGEPTGRRV